MISFIRHFLYKLAVFVVVLFVSSLGIAYLATYENYEDDGRVSSMFPIAIVRDGKPDVVRWGEYIKD